MVELIHPVQWLGVQASVTLPEHIDRSNAGQLGEELISIIKRGAAILIADMTATVSCDHAGADAVARAFQHATAAGAQLRLAVPHQAVRRVLSVNGLGCLVSIYPSLAAALAAGEPAAGAAATTWQPDGEGDLLGRIVHNLFDAGLSLQAALATPHDADRRRIAEAIECLDGIIREIRDHAFNARLGIPAPAGTPRR